MFEEMQQFIEEARQKYDLPGLGVAISLEGKTHSFVDGIRKRGEAAPLTVHDCFDYASCSKSVTALILEQLVAEKALKLSDRKSKRTCGQAYKSTAPACQAFGGQG